MLSKKHLTLCHYLLDVRCIANANSKSLPRSSSGLYSKRTCSLICFAFLRPPIAQRIKVTTLRHRMSILVRAVTRINTYIESVRRAIITRLCFSYGEACVSVALFTYGKLLSLY